MLFERSSNLVAARDAGDNKAIAVSAQAAGGWCSYLEEVDVSRYITLSWYAPTSVPVSYEG